MNGLDFNQLSKAKQIIQLQQLKEYEANANPSSTAATRKAQSLITYILSNKMPSNIKTKSIFYDQSNTMHILRNKQILELHHTQLFKASDTEKSLKKVESKEIQNKNATQIIEEDIFPDVTPLAVPLNVTSTASIIKTEACELEKEITSIFSGKTQAKNALPKKRMNDDGYNECYPQNYEEFDKNLQLDNGKLEEYYNSKELQEKDDEYVEKDRVMIKAKKKKLGARPKIDNKVRERMRESLGNKNRRGRERM